MSGVYIHIPFCRKACHYCDFHFSTSFQLKSQLIEALVHEIHRYLPSFLSNNSPPTTLYFGGGTPSLLSQTELTSIFSALFEFFPRKQLEEVTLEANPEDITKENLELWASLGINRISVGIQSFDDELLQNMNRSHSSQEALNALTLLKHHRDFVYSLDLIYGQPQQSLEILKTDIETALSFSPQHLSCYALTVEEKTALFHQIKEKKVSTLQDEEVLNHYLFLCQKLKGANYIHYEISNFALPEQYSKHNSSYWRFDSYIGFGPSAHSFDGQKRWWNVSSNALYIKKIMANQQVFEEETLSEEDLYNENLMLTFRQKKSISLTNWKVWCKKANVDEDEITQIYFAKKWIEFQDEEIALTDLGLFYGDSFSRTFFVV